MPDGQLVAHFDKHYKAGFDAGRIGIETIQQETTDKITAAIASIKGVGPAMLAKIRSAIEGAA
jgi:hypothetical protein